VSAVADQSCQRSSGQTFALSGVISMATSR
jgi:hypothetical protein